jgi:hypothetical protein
MPRIALLPLLVSIACLTPLGLRAQQTFPAPATPRTPPRDVAPEPVRAVASATIHGVITAADTGRPLRRVNVAAQLVDRTGRAGPVMPRLGERSVLTDDQGRFVLTDLIGGFWRITAAKAGFLTQQFGQRRAFETTPPVMLAGGRVLDVSIALSRAGAINGRVYDEYGDPVAGARIHLLRPRMVRQQRQLQPVGEGDVSDDTGAFRLHGLAPGEYYVTAALRVAPLDSVVQTTYAPTYYPGSGTFSDARRIFVGAGADVHIDFPVRPVRTSRVTGFVQDSSGAPASALLNLMSEAIEPGDSLGIGTATREDGSFLVADVPPGVYTLYASLRLGGLDGEVAAVPLTVYEEDLTGVTISLAKPGTMRVTLTPDTGVTRALPTSVDLVARSMRAGTETRHGVAGRVSALAMTVPPGPFRIDPEIPVGWALKAVMVGNVDLIDLPIDLKGQHDVPVRLVLTDRVATISGNVTLDRPDRVVTVVVFPEDSARWSSASRFTRSSPVDAKGAFRIAGVPGGVRYLAVAVDRLEEGEGDDPEFFARMRDHAISFPLAEGEQRVLGLAVTER